MCSGLENRRGLKAFGGSNPSPSSMNDLKHHIIESVHREGCEDENIQIRYIDGNGRWHRIAFYYTNENYKGIYGDVTSCKWHYVFDPDMKLYDDDDFIDHGYICDELYAELKFKNIK